MGKAAVSGLCGLLVSAGMAASLGAARRRSGQASGGPCHAYAMCRRHNPNAMAFDPPLTGRMRLHRSLLCLLLLGMLLHGHAGVLRQLLGAAHWHSQAAVAGPADADWLARLLAWRAALQARSPLTGSHATPGHHHAGSERHHHGRDDSTVVSLERSADSSDPLTDAPDTLSGSLLQPLGLAGRLHWCVPGDTTMCWAQVRASAWRDASARLPERPPRA
jgi:TPR repeat protein